MADNSVISTDPSVDQPVDTPVDTPVDPAPVSNSSETTTSIPLTPDQIAIKQIAINALNEYKNDQYLPWRINITDALVDSVSLLVVQLYESAVNNQDYLNVLASFFNIVIDLSETQMWTSSNTRQTLHQYGPTNLNNACFHLIGKLLPIKSFEYMLAAIPLVWVIGEYNINQDDIVKYTAKCIIKYLANYKYTIYILREITLFTNGLPGQPVNGFNMLWGNLVKLSQVTSSDTFDINTDDFTQFFLDFPDIYFNKYELVANYLIPVPVSSTVTIPKNYVPSIYSITIPNLHIDPTLLNAPIAPFMPSSLIQSDGSVNDYNGNQVPNFGPGTVPFGSAITAEGDFVFHKDILHAIQDTVPTRVRVYGSVVQDNGTLKDVSNNIIILDPTNSNQPYVLTGLPGEIPRGSVVLDDGSIFDIGRTRVDLTTLPLPTPPAVEPTSTQAGGKKKRKTIKSKKGKKSKKSKKNRRGKSLKYMV